MAVGEGAVVAFGLPVHDVLIDGCAGFGREGEGVGLRHERQDAVLLRFVRDDGHFRRGARGEADALLAHDRVPARDHNRLGELEGHGVDDAVPSVDHRAVRELLVRGFDVRPVPQHLRVAHQHVRARDADLVEPGVSHVGAVEAHLQADIARLHARPVLVILQGAQLHHEGVHAVVLASRDELGHDDGVGGGEAERAGPILGAGQGGRVDHELVRCRVECGRGLQAAEEGPVAQLGLAVGAYDLAGFDQRHPVRTLLGRGLQLERRAKHQGVVTEGRRDDESELVRVVVENAVAVLDFVVHHRFAKGQPVEILPLTAEVRVLPRQLRRVGET